MLFNSIQYLLFLPIVVALYWCVPKKARAVALLIASYYFYMSWMAAYGLLLAGLTLWNFAFGWLIARPGATHKRLLFIAAIAGNLACLALYKYTNFLIESFWSSWQWGAQFLHTNAPAGTAPLLPIILPLGISFFVFEFIHYLVDVYKGSDAIKNPVRFGLFAAFFPSQIAGPIKRFQDFDEQVVSPKPFDPALFKAGLLLIVEGMFKKVVLGDNLATLVTPGFANAAAMSTMDTWICVAAFTLQIYYDFSGYTDIGRGSAMLLGYSLPENFNMPYIAKNLSDFWHRWHISLSTWLRDYLYIPMGGSKAGKSKQARNLVVTMLLGGLWHGASWHYVVWGAFHGFGLVVTHTWQKFADKVPALKAMRETFHYDIFARVLTLFAVMIGWVVFRADNMGQAMAVYAGMFSLRPGTSPVGESITDLLFQSVLPVALLLYAGYHITIRLIRRARASQTAPQSEPAFPSVRWWLTPPVAAQAFAVLGICMLIVGFAPHKAIPFIYFQF
jgi:alginate O-acetyltransferase complex protein AlgI